MKTHPLGPLIEHYLQEKDITKGSFDLYLTILKQYVAHLIEHQIDYPKTSEVISYLEYKKSQGYKARWIYLQISTIKGLYQYLSQHYKHLELPKIYAIDITEDIPNERLQWLISKPILTIEQAKHLILFTKENRNYIWHFRDHAMIFLMLTTGLRSIEVRRARIKDLQKINEDLVLFIQGKGKSSRNVFVKISQGVKDAIYDYLGKRKDKNPYLFITHSKSSESPILSRGFFNGMIKRNLDEAGLKDVKITAHSLRHTAATINLLRGGSLDQTRAFMRHRDLQTTLIYAHHLNDATKDDEDRIENYMFKDG